MSGAGQGPFGHGLPKRRLRLVLRLGVRQEEHVAELDRAVPVVLGELVGVELGERPSKAPLGLLGERPAAVPPVDGEELGELVGALDDAFEGVRHQGGACAGTGERRRAGAGGRGAG